MKTAKTTQPATVNALVPRSPSPFNPRSFHPTKDQQGEEERKNRTGLPDGLKAGVENLSGVSLDDVKVHFNSSRPAQLHAHAFTQGMNIHVAPGQERHLPHEAWHVIQQQQGRVKETLQRNKAHINNDPGLEAEAEQMGLKANNRMQAGHLPSNSEVQHGLACGCPACSQKSYRSDPSRTAPGLDASRAAQPGVSQAVIQLCRICGDPDCVAGEKCGAPSSSAGPSSSVSGTSGIVAGQRALVEKQLNMNILKTQDPRTEEARKQAAANPLSRGLMRAGNVLTGKQNPTSEQIASEKIVGQSEARHRAQLEQVTAQAGQSSLVRDVNRKVRDVVGLDNPELSDVRRAEGSERSLEQHAPGYKGWKMAGTAINVGNRLGQIALSGASTVVPPLAAAKPVLNVAAEAAQAGAEKKQKEILETAIVPPNIEPLRQARSGVLGSQASDRKVNAVVRGVTGAVGFIPGADEGVGKLAEQAGKKVVNTATEAIGKKVKGESTAERQQEAAVSAMRGEQRTLVKPTGPSSRLPSEKEIKKAKEKLKKGK